MTAPRINAALAGALAATGQAELGDALVAAAAQTRYLLHGRIADWERAVEVLAPFAADGPELDRASPRLGTADADPAALAPALETLIPWRKGPLTLAGTDIETEWRSDWKWERLAPHIAKLEGRRVLDVGCGNGYFVLRALGAGARWAIGIDPTALFVMQYRALATLAPGLPATVLPLALEEMPALEREFDTVFSLGVIYHRRSPIEHLAALKTLLRPGGELVLESLVVPGDASTVLVPEDRYARMRNVWFVPSSLALERWLVRLGFGDVRTVVTATTTVEEQHTTRWMPFESLAEALDPLDSGRTVEGHPAPTRAVVIANRTVS